MKLHFTKMQGAGNDFVVLDATTAPLNLTPESLRRLADRRYGVGADQILLVERSRRPGIDFRYRIYNGPSGNEVEHCGNGARCLLRFLHQRGLTDKKDVRIETVNNLIELHMQDDGRVTVDMNRPVFDLTRVPFDADGLHAQTVNGCALWPLRLEATSEEVDVAVLSMGNPHAVQRVDDVDTAPVERQGPLIEQHPRFTRGVNAGFLQVVSRNAVRLRVFERGAGETLACGTGACAAVVAGIRLGWLDARVDVETRGGRLTVEWAGRRAGVPSDDAWAPVLMTGPAETVFEGDITL